MRFISFVEELLVAGVLLEFSLFVVKFHIFSFVGLGNENALVLLTGTVKSSVWCPLSLSLPPLKFQVFDTDPGYERQLIFID